MAALNRWFSAELQGRAQALYSSLYFGGGSVVGGGAVVAPMKHARSRVHVMPACLDGASGKSP